MVERSDEDKSCTGPGNGPVNAGSKKRPTPKEKEIEDTQGGDPGASQISQVSNRDATKGADTTQVTDATEGDRSATGPVARAIPGAASSKQSDMSKLDMMIGGGGSRVGGPEAGKKMDKLDITALNNMERSHEDDDDSFEKTWAFWRKKKRRAKGKRKRTKTKTKKTKYPKDRAASVKKEFVNPFEPGAPPPDEVSAVVDTVGATTEGGVGITEVVNKVEKKHNENEKKYRKKIIDQQAEQARLGLRVCELQAELAMAEERRKRTCWNFFTGSPAVLAMSSGAIMSCIFVAYFFLLSTCFGSALEFTEQPRVWSS